MLVLTRREHEEILIPGLGIKLHVVSIQGSKVKIGIDAPQKVKIVRGELVSNSAMTQSTQDDPKPEKSRVTQQKQPLQSYLARRDQPSETIIANGLDYASDSVNPIVREVAIGYEVCA